MKFPRRCFMWACLALAGLAMGACERHHFDDTKVLHGDHGAHPEGEGDEGGEHAEETAQPEQGSGGGAGASGSEEAPGVSREVGI